MSQSATQSWRAKEKLWDDDVTDEEEYNKVEDMTPFAVEVDTNILLAEEEAPYAHHDHSEGTIIKRTIINILLVE